MLEDTPKVDKSRKFNYDDFIKMGQDTGRIVVAYDGGIFDVTDFSGHPGGVGRLQMANGEIFGLGLVLVRSDKESSQWSNFNSMRISENSL